MKIIVENFTLKHLLLSEICIHELCEKLHAPISMAVRKRRVTFLICLRKRGIPRKEGGERGEFPQRESRPWFQFLPAFEA